MGRGELQMELSSSSGSLQSAHPWLSCLLLHCPQGRGSLCLISPHILLNSKWLLQLLGLADTRSPGVCMLSSRGMVQHRQEYFSFFVHLSLLLHL